MMVKSDNIGDYSKHSNWLTKELFTVLESEVTMSTILAALVCLPLTITWYMTRYWVLNNLIALCMASVFLKVV